MVEVDDCSVANVSQLDPPVFVRKVARKRHWGNESDNVEERVESIVLQVFESNDHPLSFFKVSSDIELHQVAIGLNSNRSSLKEELFFVAFAEQELSSGQIVSSAGDTRCECANGLHVDITFTNEGLKNICRDAISKKRLVCRLSKSKMKRILNHRNCKTLMDTTESCS